MIINKVNIDKWLFDYFEGNLSTHEKMEIERFIEANPQFEIDLDSWEDSYDIAQEVPVYNIPNSLYKQPFLVANKYLAVGVLLLMLSLSGIVFYNLNNKTVEGSYVVNLTAESEISEWSVSSEKTDEVSLDEKKINSIQNTQVNTEENKIKIEKGIEITESDNEVSNNEGHYSNEFNSRTANEDEIKTKVQATLNSANKVNNKALYFNELKNKAKQKNKPFKKGGTRLNKLKKQSTIKKNERNTSTLSVNKRNNITYRANRRPIKKIEIKNSEQKVEKYYKDFKKENLNEKYKYLNYSRARKKGGFANQIEKREHDKLEKENELQKRKLEYFDNIAIIGVLFDKKGKVSTRKKVSLIDKLRRKELALVNTHDPIFITDKPNPLANNIALTGGLEMTRFKLNAVDSWRGTLNNNTGGVLSVDTYLQKINAGVGLFVQSRNYNEIGIYSTNVGLVYAQRIDIRENKSLSLGAKYNHVLTRFNTEKLNGQDGGYEVELEQNNSFLMTNNLQNIPNNEQNNLSFGAWYDGDYFYGGMNVENLKTKKSENNNANQFVEYINPVKFAVQLGTDYRKNAYSALIISPQLSYRYQQDMSEFWAGSILKYKNFLTGIGGSTNKSFKVNIGVQGDKMRLIYGFNYAKSVAESKFYGTHDVSLRYILRSKNNCKKK